MLFQYQVFALDKKLGGNGKLTDTGFSDIKNI